MGIIGRQAAKLTIANLLSVIIGFFNTIYIYPLDKGIYGLAMFVLSVGTLLEMFTSLGLHSLTLRFFPKFKNPHNGNSGFLLFALTYMVIGLIFFSTLFWLFSGFFFQMLQDNRPENAYYLNLFFDFIPLIVGLITLQTFLINYLSQFQRVVIPGIIFGILPKIWIPCAFLLTYHHIFSDQMLVNSIIGMLGVSLTILIYYLKVLGQLNLRPQWSNYPAIQVKEMVTYALFSLLGTAGAQMAYRIDQSMLGSIVSMEALGLFSLALTFTATVEMPAKSVLNITGPIISDLIKKEQFTAINQLYQRSALNMFAAGLFLFLGLYLVADDIFRMTKNAETLLIAQQIALILALGKLFDMVTGPNDLIIGLSRYYKFNLICIFLLSLGNVLLNFKFITLYDVYGPAFASLIFLFLFNIIKVIFLKIKFNMLPFSSNMLYLIGLALVCIGLDFLIPDSTSVFINFLVGGLILLIVYVCPFVYWKIAPDLVNMLYGGLGSLGIKTPFKK
jgi:O-antigen/teichoic acid export membrane protein